MKELHRFADIVRTEHVQKHVQLSGQSNSHRLTSHVEHVDPIASNVFEGPCWDHDIGHDLSADHSVGDISDTVTSRGCIEVFDGAGKTYGAGETFMDRFNADTYAEYRKTNLYYPFASKQDWEIAAFLESSNLSMAAIDKFLSLELVGVISLHVLRLLTVSTSPDIPPSAFISHL